MKILIIGTPRSGTSALVRAFSNSIGCKSYGEPWNRSLRENQLPFPYQFENKCVVKTLVHDIPEEFKDKPILDFYSALSSSFDKIILLGRKNIDDLTVSFAYQMEEDEKKKRTRNSWHTPYTVDIKNLDIPRWKPEVKKWCTLLQDISIHLNTNITWYEDLYSGNTQYVDKFIKNLEVDLNKKTFYKWVNPDKKLRRQRLPLI
tara:strand:+ start:64 stop:672 length:609 start_codon:yes stop_codon:yes gene_type:complete